MTSLSPQARKNAWRGAKIGAVSMGCASFSTGILMCVVHRLQVPPLAVTELGIMVGGVLGAGLGVLCTTTRGRYSLLGILAGLLVGGLIGWATAGGADPLGVARVALLGGLIGWRLALNSARALLERPAWSPAVKES